MQQVKCSGQNIVDGIIQGEDMNKYQDIKFTLIESKYEHKNYSAIIDAPIEIFLEDKIVIKKITDDEIGLEVGRTVKFSPFKDSYFTAVFLTQIITEKPVAKEQFIADIKKGLPMMSSVFSQISLTLAQLSNMTIFGTIVTPPVYYGDKINIE